MGGYGLKANPEEYGDLMDIGADRICSSALMTIIDNRHAEKLCLGRKEIAHSLCTAFMLIIKGRQHVARLQCAITG
jgi:hypothetical protein